MTLPFMRAATFAMVTRDAAETLTPTVPPPPVTEMRTMEEPPVVGAPPFSSLPESWLSVWALFASMRSETFLFVAASPMDAPFSVRSPLAAPVAALTVILPPALSAALPRTSAKTFEASVAEATPTPTPAPPPPTATVPATSVARRRSEATTLMSPPAVMEAPEPTEALVASS